MADFAPAVPRFFPEGFFAQEDFLRLFDRLLPDYYLAPLKSPGPGYEYLQAVAKTMSRASEAASHMASGSYVGSATGGRRAYATVQISRMGSAFGAVTLLPGTLVGTSDGYLYQTLTSVSFGASEIGSKLVEVESTARGWDWNKPGPVLAASGEMLSGSINRLVSAVVPVGGSVDPTLTVQQVAAAPYTLTTLMTQPAVKGLVRLNLTATGITPRVGAVLYIGNSPTVVNNPTARDEYVVTEILSTSPFSCVAQLVSYALNAPGSTVSAGTVVYATSDACGGESMMLDGLGIDRGVLRNNTYARVQFALSPADNHTVTFMPGTRVRTADGYLYQILDAVNFPAGSTAPQPARAIPVVLPDEYAAHGDITTVDLIKYGSAAYSGGGTISVTQVQPYTQEPDDAYRARIALLPYVVTPNAVQHLLDQLIGGLLAAAGQTYSWREIWDIRFQTAYDTPPDLLPFTQAEQGVVVPPYNPNIFVYDYEPEDPLSNRYLYPERGMIVFALPEVAGLEKPYAALASALDGATPAGISLGYILT